MLLQGSSYMKKSEQVSSDHQKMSLVVVLRSDAQGRGQGRGCPTPTLSHDAFDVTYPTVNRQTPVKTLPISAISFAGGNEQPRTAQFSQGVNWISKLDVFAVAVLHYLFRSDSLLRECR